MHRNQSVNVHQFAMVPRSDIPRSSFRMQKTHKTAFDAGWLIPVFCEEVLPGDSFTLKMTAFARMTTPLVPVMDNLHLDTFFFFVPNRLSWTNWVKFMGEQDNPADSISFTCPYVLTTGGGEPVASIYDYFGIPVLGQSPVSPLGVNALPFRAYNRIWNEWFRDENLQNSVVENVGDGPDATGDYALLKRGKRHDYFTSALPWTQKGNTAVTIPLGTTATVKTNATELFTGAQAGMQMRYAAGGVLAGNVQIRSVGGAGGGLIESTTADATSQGTQLYPTNLYADLSTATAATINQLRQSFQIQKLLERDARGGTRYTEIVRSHFGVVSPDARLQRPEYLGGGSQAISINPIAQTSATTVTGSTTPIGKLAAFGTVLVQGHGFSQSFTEHGYVLGLVSVRADLTYQQGLRRHWTRRTRYDFYFPAFANLGEQSILNREIYCVGGSSDDQVFGYQERWAEYRYLPSEITGKMRSTAAGTVDYWHLAQRFVSLPSLNATFIEENPPISRVVAVTTEPQFFGDFFFDVKAARPLPMYSVPGLIDHF